AERVLPLKDRLSSSDAEAIEAAFAARLKQVDAPAVDAKSAAQDAAIGQQDGAVQTASAAGVLPQAKRAVAPAMKEQPPLPLAKRLRRRDKQHLKFVGTQPCLICGRTPCDAHHVKFADGQSMGRKVSDEFTVPLCRLHHRELHRCGNERAWWEQQELDP